MTSENNEVFDVSFDVNDNFDSNEGFDIDSSNNPSQVAHNDIVTTDSSNSEQVSNFVQISEVTIENTLVIEDKSVISNVVVDQSNNQAFSASNTQGNIEANLADDVTNNLVDELDKVENSKLDEIKSNSSDESNNGVIANFPTLVNKQIDNDDSYSIEENNELSANNGNVEEETTLDLSDDLVAGDGFPTNQPVNQPVNQPTNITPIALAANIPNVDNTGISNIKPNNLSLPTNLNANVEPSSRGFDVNNPSTFEGATNNKPSNLSGSLPNTLVRNKNLANENLASTTDSNIKEIAETVTIPDEVFESAINSEPNDNSLNTYRNVTANSTTSEVYHNPLDPNNSIGKDPATDNISYVSYNRNNDQGSNNQIESKNSDNNEENNESSNINNDDGSDVIENVLPLTTPQNTTTRLMGKASSDGSLSKRVIGVAVILVVGGLLVWGTQENTNKGSANNKVATIKPIQVEKSNLKNTLNSPSMGERPDQGRMLPPPEVVEPPPPVIIAPPPEPPPLGGGQPVIVNNTEAPPRQYSFQMRRGNMVMQKWEQEQKNELANLQARNNKPTNNEQATSVKIPRGTVIPMMMIQPFRNDLPGVVKCQVMVDVKTAKGQVLIPAGSIASVPFSQFRNDKRVFNRVDTPTIISVSTNSNSANAASPTNADGVVNEANEIQLFGTAMDRKGFVGLEGKLRKTGDASVIKRVGRTMARALTFGAASSVGGATGVVVSEGGNSAIDSTYFYTDRTGTFVELPLGTMFFFNVN
ncbi:MAG: hypothetical protein WAQ98_33755 [Blastocatellia bacterium]